MPATFDHPHGRLHEEPVSGVSYANGCTKIYLTPKISDGNIREIITDRPPGTGHYSYRDIGCWVWINGSYEGVDWHRNREDAVMVARQHRANRLAEAAKEFARLHALPEIV